MKIATIIVRVLLGLMFVVFGSNAFLQFMPMPEMTGYPAQFIGSMAGTGYLKFIAALEILGGLLLLIGRYVPLGLTLLGPIVVNIVLYHLCMDMNGMPVAIVVAALGLFLLWRYWDAFAGVLRA
jgi:uncharacterized membrane protein YphA (DoxX/SURF4 family)